MTAEPCALAPGDSAMDAARLMRDNDIGDVVVVDEDHLYGIVTDRDIVVRVLAEQCDPASIRLADICGREVTTIAPDASLGGRCG
jgi:CBS domain-containing protein